MWQQLLKTRKLERPTSPTTPLAKRAETWVRWRPSGWERGETEWVKCNGHPHHWGWANWLPCSSELSPYPWPNDCFLCPVHKANAALPISSACFSLTWWLLDVSGEPSNQTAFQPSGLQWNAVRLWPITYDCIKFGNLMLAHLHSHSVLRDRVPRDCFQRWNHAVGYT